MLAIKFQMILRKGAYTSNIVSYNSIQTLKFEHMISFWKSYAPEILTPTYIYLNLRKCETKQFMKRFAIF